MTKRDFEAIAKVIREASMWSSERAALTLDMEAALRPLNRNWDSLRWHNACRPNQDDEPMFYAGTQPA